MNDEDRTAFLHLEWATQALALDGEVQLALFPEFVDRPYELVDDFDNWFGATRWRTSLAISSEQMTGLKELQEAITGLGEEDLTEEAVRNSASWAKVRLVARRVLESFMWPNTSPPSGRSTYVPAG